MRPTNLTAAKFMKHDSPKRPMSSHEKQKTNTKSNEMKSEKLMALKIHELDVKTSTLIGQSRTKRDILKMYL